MTDEKASLIITIKNEESTIENLLDSILNQRKKPDQIVIVDGGSTDGTLEIISKYKDILPIKLISHKNANIAKGRNLAISHAKYPIIAVTDAGCILDQNWYKEIVRPIEILNVDVVSGIYFGTGDSLFQKVVSQLLVYNFDKVKGDSFSPSSRSIAFKKKAWKRVKGYPEWLNYAEDTYFNRKLREIGCTFYLNKKAIVYWQMRSNILKLFKQHFNYAMYDAIGLNNIHSYALKMLFWYIFIFILTSSIMLNLYLLTFTILIVFLTLFSYVVFRKIGFSKLTIKKFFLGLVIIITVEITKFLGYFYGLLKRARQMVKEIIDGKLRKIITLLMTI